MKRIWVAAALALLLGGCATTYAIAPEAAAGQGVRYERGRPTVVSVQPHGVVRVSPAAKSYTDRVVLNVVAFNNGPGPANLGYENVSVATSDGVPMQLFTVTQLEREARNKAAWAAFAVALAGAADTYAAQQSAYSHGYGSVSTYSPYGHGFSTYSYTTYNPALANALTQQAADRTSANIGQISAALDATIEKLEGHILQTTTIDVGQIDGGQVVVDKPKLAKGGLTGFTVRVAFNGDTHEFRFNAGSEDTIAQMPIPAARDAPPPAPIPAPVRGPTSAAAQRTAAVQPEQAPARATPVAHQIPPSTAQDKSCQPSEPDAVIYKVCRSAGVVIR